MSAPDAPNRRSFLRLLGLTVTAPVVAPAIPSPISTPLPAPAVALPEDGMRCSSYSIQWSMMGSASYYDDRFDR